MTATSDYIRLDGGAVSLVFKLENGGAADLIYLGDSLPQSEDLAALAASQARGAHESQPDTPSTPGLLPERKDGWFGKPALEVWSLQGSTFEPHPTDFSVVDWNTGERDLLIRYSDAASSIQVEQSWSLGDGDALKVHSRVRNNRKSPVRIAHAAAIAMPIPMQFSHVTRYSGRWTHEMQEYREPLAPADFVQASSHGKPGFGGNWLILDDPQSGAVLGAHLAWSGDYETRVDCDQPGNSDGRAVLQLSAQLSSGEIELAPGDAFQTPQAVLAIAPNRSALAQSLHQYVRAERLPFQASKTPRKVHINSWDALGISLSLPKLTSLADAAAEVGVERFILDDGWFSGRRNTSSSLGDWRVCSDIFPDGLKPLINHVQSLGMDFGIWVEPEMVSPDSDLYRAHPDWCLHIEGQDRPTMRGQLVLDLSRSDVVDAIFAQLDTLLSAHDIAYLKWDHNRDLFPVTQRHGQTLGTYVLLDRVRTAHPMVEIESCAEGGGRIDYGMLSRCHRVWPSDNNDPIERVRIMQAWSQFLPLEVLGNHVGPSPNPITGRRTDMDFRAKVALFGHMGVEADPRAMSDEERDVLASHIALYKEWRGVLHSGAYWRLDHPDQGVFAQMVVGEEHALAMAAQTRFAPEFDVAPLRLAGLEPEVFYRVTLPEPWPKKASDYLAEPERWRSGLELSGRALMTQGLALPLTHPETAWLIALERLS